MTGQNVAVPRTRSSSFRYWCYSVPRSAIRQLQQRVQTLRQSTMQLTQSQTGTLVRQAHVCPGAKPRRVVVAPRATPVDSNTRAVPASPELQVSQAVTAIEAAWQDGIKRQRLELLLPLIGATDLDDWPGGIRQQFKAAAPLVEGILKQLKQKEGLQGPIDVDIWDQGDAVGAWFGDKLAAVLFPTADTQKQLKQLAERSPNTPELLLIANPQWELQGNLVSEFGFGSRKEAAMAFIDSFEPTYFFKQQRVAGDDIRLLRAYPGKWQLHVVKKDGSNQLLQTFDSKPSYAELEEALKAWPEAATNKSLMDRLRDEVKFIQDTAQQPGGKNE